MALALADVAPGTLQVVPQEARPGQEVGLRQGGEDGLYQLTEGDYITNLAALSPSIFVTVLS